MIGPEQKLFNSYRLTNNNHDIFYQNVNWFRSNILPWHGDFKISYLAANKFQWQFELLENVSSELNICELYITAPNRNA